MKTAYSHVFQKDVAIIHEYDCNGRMLFHCTWDGIDNETGYVIHSEIELDMTETNS